MEDAATIRTERTALNVHDERVIADGAWGE